MSVAEIKSALRELEPDDLNAIESFLVDLRLEQAVGAGEFDAQWERPSRMWTPARVRHSMISSTTTPEFWKCYRGAPDEIRRASQKAYRLWRENPQHPSLHFKPVGNFWSVRITRSWRALGRYHNGVLVWFWMGSHAPYERKLK